MPDVVGRRDAPTHVLQQRLVQRNKSLGRSDTVEPGVQDLARQLALDLLVFKLYGRHGVHEVAGSDAAAGSDNGSDGSEGVSHRSLAHVQLVEKAGGVGEVEG